MLNKQTIRSDKKKKQQKKILFIKACVYFFVACLLLGIFSYVFNLKRFLISNIIVRQQVRLDIANVENKVKSVMAGKYLYLFAKNNSFIYSSNNIEDALLQSFSRLQSINTKLISANTLIVTLNERRTFAIWCGDGFNETRAQTSTENCFYIDKTGYIFDKAPNFKGNSLFRYYANFASSTPLGKNILNDKKFADINYFLESLKNLDIKPFASDIKKDEFSVFLDEGGSIIVPIMDDYSRIYEDIRSILISDEIGVEIKNSLSKDSPAKLDYIDMRFGNKVYYKWQENDE